MCIDPSTLLLSGDDEGSFHNLLLYIDPCDGEVRECAPKEEINALVDRLDIKIFVSDHFVRKDNFTHPIGAELKKMGSAEIHLNSSYK